MKLRSNKNGKRGKNSDKVLRIKECRVNLVRINKETIERMMCGRSEPNTKNFNFELKFNRGKWICVKHPDEVVPKISPSGNISISIHNAVHGTAIVSNSSLSCKLRPRPEKVATTAKKLVPSTKSLAVLSVSVQKTNLWSACKKRWS